jgi:hypothetical protein
MYCVVKIKCNSNVKIKCNIKIIFFCNLEIFKIGNDLLNYIKDINFELTIDETEESIQIQNH